MSDIKEKLPSKVISRQELALGAFGSSDSFDFYQRGAMLFSKSTLVPKAYRTVDDYGKEISNPAAVSNCFIALSIANRIGMDPIMVMQNMNVIDGRPSWSSKFLIAALNSTGKFSPLRFEYIDLGEKEVSYKVWTGPKDNRRQEVVKVKVHNQKCRVVVKELATDEKLTGPWVSIEMAVAEGWYGRTGSKWPTMPEIMLQYRAASFFASIYAPEVALGIKTQEEVEDIAYVEVNSRPARAETGNISALKEAVENQQKEQPEQKKETGQQRARSGRKKDDPAKQSPSDPVTPTVNTEQAHEPEGGSSSSDDDYDDFEEETPDDDMK